MKNKSIKDYNKRKSLLKFEDVNKVPSVSRVHDTESINRVEFIEKLLNLKLKIEQEHTRQAKIMANLEENLSMTREISNRLDSIISEKAHTRNKVLDEFISGFRKLIRENNTESLKEIINGMIGIISSPVIIHQEVEAVSSVLTRDKNSNSENQQDIIDVGPEKVTILD